MRNVSGYGATQADRGYGGTQGDEGRYKQVGTWGNMSRQRDVERHGGSWELWGCGGT